MPDFLYVYHGGKRPETPAEQEAVMAAWGKWMEDNGKAMVNPGNPVGMSKTVHAKGVTDNGGANPSSGFTIVRADTMDGALKIAKGCPILAAGGTVEVAPIMAM